MWSRDMYLLRENDKVFKKLIIKLKNEGEEFYKKFVRISFTDFDYIHNRIKDKIKTKYTVMRRAITTGERLAVILWYLSSGKCIYKVKLIKKCSVV